MNKMDGHQYEHECAKLLRKNGFTNIQITKASGDQGIDIIANAFGKKYGIQCKYYTSPVGNFSVQEAYAGARFYNCDIAAVLTNSTFTPAAIELAKKTHVVLWDNNHIDIKYPLINRFIKLLGTFMTLLAILSICSILFFKNILLKPIQLVQSISLLMGGIFNILQSKNVPVGKLAVGCYIFSFVMSFVFCILTKTLKGEAYSFIFLFAALVSYISMKNATKEKCL